VNVIGAPWHRAEILRALHKLTAGVPLLTPTEAQGMGLLRATKRDLRLMDAAGSEDLALLNACLSVEAALREEEFATLERLLCLCQFGEGDLDERVLALPKRAFVRAAADLDALGWMPTDHTEHSKED